MIMDWLSSYEKESKVESLLNYSIEILQIPIETLTPLPFFALTQHVTSTLPRRQSKEGFISVSLSCFAREESERTNKWRIDISGRFGLLVVVPVVGEMIVAVRASNDGPDKHIRVGRPWVKILEPIAARDAARVWAHGREGRSPVVHVQGVPVTKPYHVRSPRRVVP